jgi:thiamine monophosphate synthase
MDIEPEALSEPLDILDGMLAERGRHRDEITVSVIPPVGGCDIDKIKRYRDAGADRVVIMEFVHALDQLESVVDRLAEQIVEPARGL